VKYNNDKSRDYTNPILPANENSNEPISIGAKYVPGLPNVYGSPIVTLAGAPLTTLSAMNNGAIHFPSTIETKKKEQSTFTIVLNVYLASTAAMLNASQLTQPYTTAIACPISNGANSAATLLTAAGTTQSQLSLSTLQQQQQQQQQRHHHHHHHQHASTTSPYIFLSTSDEVCANGGTTGVTTGKTATLSSPSALYFYNNNSTPAMYSADFLRL